MVSVFLKRGAIIAVLSMTLGLLTLAVVDDISWALFASMGTFVIGLLVGIWRDRRIKRAFMENPLWSPLETVDQFRFGRRRGNA